MSISTTKSPRQQHLDWCKQRALQYCDQGDANQAFLSMVSDLEKDESTAGHAAIELGMMLLMGGHLSTASEMRTFIEGFN